MPDANWIDDGAQLPALARTLEGHPSIGLDTEFLRERTFYPKLCLLQIAAGDAIWCVDTLKIGPLDALLPVLTGAATRKLLHAARQDLEAVYLTSKAVMTPVFDTQVAAGCAGLKPQIGYADLVKTLLEVTVPKGQTRTDWSKRPLTREQMEYAADDVLYLGRIADILGARLRDLGREHWVTQDCAELSQRHLYEPDLSQSWTRLKGIAQLPAAPRARAKAVAVWRERVARERDLPRAWIIPDPAVFAIAYNNPSTAQALESIHKLNERFATSLLEVLRDMIPPQSEDDEMPADLRPTPEQKALIDRLAKVADARAAELQVSAEVLAPRGELKAIALGRRDTHCMSGWRREEIGERLLEAVG
jgi:ribonuclease D